MDGNRIPFQAGTCGKCQETKPLADTRVDGSAQWLCLPCALELYGEGKDVRLPAVVNHKVIYKSVASLTPNPSVMSLKDYITRRLALAMLGKMRETNVFGKLKQQLADLPVTSKPDGI